MFASKDELFTRPSGGYTIGRSVRLRSSASAYLNRTPSVAGNQQIFTWSGWVKRGKLGTAQGIFGPTQGSGYATTQKLSTVFFNSSDQLQWSEYYTLDGQTDNWSYALITTQVFRDPSAWYHIVFAMDTTQATASNRMKLYVNGIQITSFATANYVTQNFNSWVNSTSTVHYFGTYGTSGLSNFYDGYLAEVNFVNAQQLTPSSFGSTNSITGVWQPAKYTGTYGTNGFYLNFSSNGTAAALGTDFSGNSNTWTVNNISVTAGVTYDSMTDVPTLTSATAANYCVLNPLDKGAGVVGAGNLSWQYTTAAQAGVRASMDMLGGNWYFEGTYTQGGTAGSSAIGIALPTWSLATYAGDTGSWSYHANGNKYVNGTGSAYGATYTTGDVIGIAFNSSTGTLTGYKNGTSQGTIVSGLSVTSYFAAVSSYDSSAWAINFGQRPFSYTPPTGYVALNTYNLPTSTITNGAAYMAATLYNGNGGTQSITNTVSGTSFQPDLVWIKTRSASSYHQLVDSVRGVSKVLNSNYTGAESTYTGFSVTAFNSNGVTVVDDAASSYGVNGSTGSPTYVGWQWKAGTTSASNTNGSITSTVSAGATQGFSVVTYTGISVPGTVGHGLGVAPSMVIVKSRNNTSSWAVWQTALTGNEYLLLESTAAKATASTVWNGTTPTSTVFSVGSGSVPNNNGYTYVAYCFAAVAGFSAFGSYTGNGSADGTFVYLGFKPRWIMIGPSSNVTNWAIIDTSRDTYNLAGQSLEANLSAAEYTPASSGYPIDILSNGFKQRGTSQPNTSGQTYIYAAFAENPFKNALAR